MKRLFPKQLLPQFLLFILGIIGIVLVIQIAFLLNIREKEKATSQNYVENIVNSVEHTLQTNLQNFERAGFSLSYNTDLIKIYSQQLDTQTTIAGVLDVVKLIYYENQGELVDVSLIGLDGINRSLLMGIPSEMFDAIRELYNFSDPKNTDRAFFFFKPGTAFRTSHYVYVAPLVNFVSSPTGVNTKLATVVFVGELTSIKRALSIVEPENVILWITDRNGETVLNNEPGMIDSSESHPEFQTSISFTKKIYDTNFQIHGVVVRQNSVEAQQIIQYIFIMMLVFVMTLLFTFVFFRYRISIPMNQLQSDIDQVGRLGLRKRVKLDGGAEFGHIASWINTMLERLEKTTEENQISQQKLFETEILKKQAELSSLRSQINPHFLYNTLQCMRGIAMEHDVPELATMASELFEIFRYSIKGGDLTSIQKEIFIAQQYLHIFQIRYEGKFEYSIDVDDDVMELTINKLILQPIIENSIQHGFVHHQGMMRIQVRVFRKNDEVIIWVLDNGTGISAEKMAEIQTLLSQDFQILSENMGASSIGLVNIHRRMKLTFGDQYHMEIQNVELGTRVQITIPVIEYHEPLSNALKN